MQLQSLLEELATLRVVVRVCLPESNVYPS